PQGAVTSHEGKANAHPISGVAGLQAALDAKVPTSRKVNNKALTGDITLTPADVGAVSKSGDTMTGDLTMGAQKVVGTSAGYYLNLMGGNSSPILASSASVIIHGDSDGSGTAEFVSLRAGAGTANELKILSKTSSAGVNNSALTFNGNVVYHAGNKPTAADVGLGNVNNTADSTKNVLSATKLATPRQINGTNFDGTANITTANWGTARTLTIGNTAKSVNGGGNVAWSLTEIGALPIIGGNLTGTLGIKNVTGSCGSVITPEAENGSGIYWGNASQWSRIHAKEGVVQVYDGTTISRVYHQRFKPTASDVGLGNVPNTEHTANATANTVAVRDGSADLNARLFRSNYANQSTISGAMAFRINNGSDN
ncbi:MAG: hypothetical protein ACRC9H_19975, partial [Aeromonas veronii]